MKKYIVIPTYKEYENLRLLLPLLRRYNVVIVDDNSNDGTIELCKKFKNVHLIIRPRRQGISTAVMDALRLIPKEAYVVVMDADFQHDYKKIEEMFRMLKEYDFVEGIRINKEIMGKLRTAISNVADSLVYYLVPETKALKDKETGFFGFRMQSVDINKIKPEEGEWKIVLDIFLALKKGSKIGHLYYKFGRRKYGKSKFSLYVAYKYLLQILRLNNYRILKFAFVGSLGIIVNELILFALVSKLLWPEYISLVFSIEGSVLFNFALLEFWVFRGRGKGILKNLLNYHISVFYSLVINYVIAFSLSFFISYLISNLIGIIVSFLFRYLYSEVKVWVVQI